MDNRPNILILLADQHRAESLGCYGNEEVRSPQLDRMADEGVRFTNCVSTHPLCAPYRGTLQTGHYAHRHRVTFNDQDIDYTLRSLPDRFHAAGYRSAYFGKCHWTSDVPNPAWVAPEKRLGWQHWVGWNNGHHDFDMPTYDAQHQWKHEYRGRHAPEVQTELLLEWMDAQGDQPWIAQLNYGPPHNISNDSFGAPDVMGRTRRLNAELRLGMSEQHFEKRLWWISTFPQHLITDAVPQRYLDRYDRESLTLPPNIDPHWHTLARYQMHEYYAMVSAVDDQVGRTLSHLRHRGDGRPTIVIYTSDHGDWVCSHRGRNEFVRGKNNPHQCASRVPLLLWSSDGGAVAGGRTCDAPLATIDLLPTLLDLAGLDPEPDLPGVSHAPWAVDDAGPRQSDVLIGLSNWRAIFDGQYIYAVRRPGDAPARPWLLFDTTTDPHDLNDLADDANYMDRLRDLHARLAARLRAANDDFPLENVP